MNEKRNKEYVVDPTEHLRLANHVTQRFVDGSTPVVDTEEYSDAMLGLLSASREYNPEKHKTKFSTFAHDCIRKSIIQGWRNRNCAKRTPKNQFSISDSETDIDIVDSRKHKNYHKAIEAICQPHPNDTDKDIRNKKILYDHYINGKTWTEISEEMGVTKTCVQQYGMSAIETLKVRYGVKNFESIDEFAEEF